LGNRQKKWVVETYSNSSFPAKIPQMIDAKSWGAYASRVWRSASRRTLLHAAQNDVGQAFCLPVWRASGAPTTARLEAVPTGRPEARPTPLPVVSASMPFHSVANGGRGASRFNNCFENALIFNARQTPFNPAILLQFCYHPILPLTPYSSALCAVSAAASTLRDSRKTRRVSYCSSISCKAKQAKRHEKNLAVFSGHFAGKTLENQGKMAKNTPKKHVTILQLLTCFFLRNLSIKVKISCGLRTILDSGPKTTLDCPWWPRRKAMAGGAATNILLQMPGNLSNLTDRTGENHVAEHFKRILL
jgi:hypothetical protein